MAIYTVYDLETTGLSTSSANILTFTYASFYGRDIFEPRDSGTLFFFKPEWDIPAESTRIHGLTEEKMLPHVGEFRLNCRSMWKVLQRANVVGQNIKSYDNVLVKSFFKRQGYSDLELNRVMDIRYGIGRSASLDDLLEHFKITQSNIMDYWRIIFPNSTFSEAEVMHHNGEYDVVASTLIWLKVCASGAKDFQGVD